ncbi:MAG TPA: mandelate racemase/muconate lactonizing enzyme family protein [Dehalococcoidia bacterium]|nr:mandelate racemase/muconate lactonizing enzyme family protein [Dehalococcoidia bacterium]
MQIVDVRTIQLSYRCEQPYMSAGGIQRARSVLLVQIETDEGLVGLGEAGGPLGSTQVFVEQQLKPLLVGEDPLLVERLWQKMFHRTRAIGRRGLVMYAISGVDIALWDIVGKVAKLPLFRLFGAFRDTVEAYASGGFYQEGKDVAALAREAEGYVAQGFRAMKMKVGRNPSTQTNTNLREMQADHEMCVVSLDEDLARVEAVRKALGREAKLMVDANCVWSPALAIQMGKGMEPFDIYWLEEPVATDDVRGSAEVARALTTPIAGYETESGLYGFRELIEQGAVDVVQPDIARAGGFTECRRIAALAQAYNLTVAPHAFSSAINLVASMHLLASLPNGLQLEYDQNPNGLRTDLLKEPITADHHGSVKLPERPGLGVELNPEAVERYRVG